MPLNSRAKIQQLGPRLVVSHTAQGRERGNWSCTPLFFLHSPEGGRGGGESKEAFGPEMFKAKAQTGLPRAQEQQLDSETFTAD